MARIDSFVIPKATADVRIELAFTVYIRGSWAPHADALEHLWRTLLGGRIGARLRWHRPTADRAFKSVGSLSRDLDFSDFLDLAGPPPPCRGVEFSDEPEDLGHPGGTRLRVVDLAAVRGAPRASYLRFSSADAGAEQDILALADFCATRMPLWWGTAGFVFNRASGTSYTVYNTMAALAKRYWCVQVEEIERRHWDALDGISGVNWLTLVGDPFARERGVDPDALAASASQLDKVFVRRRPGGVVLAAGGVPIKGDINLDEDMNGHVALQAQLQPLLLQSHPLLFGSFQRPEVLKAWRERFERPRDWLECEVSPGPR